MPREVAMPNAPAQLAPNAVSVDGLAQAGFLPSHLRATRPGRSRDAADRRVTSYFNYFSSRSNISADAPPTYSRSQRDAGFKISRRPEDGGLERLPQYTCTVYKESVMHMRVEACSPFMTLPFQEWRPVFVVIQGTQLNIHKIKNTTVGKEQVAVAGRLLRNYTLQHAEVGLAPDVEYSLMIPKTKLAALIPPLARKRALQKDPELFAVETHSSMRIRSELDQFVLSHPEEEQIMSWVNHVCAGIDIAPTIDDRALPRQTTMPRRRRRHVDPTDITDERVIEQQRRMLAMYPSLAADQPDSNLLAPPPAMASLSPSRSQSIAHTPISGNRPGDQDGEDIDLSALAEESGSMRPTSSVSDALHSDSNGPTRSGSRAAQLTLAALNFDEDGKWAPRHPCTAAHHWRYMKRCMPVLLPETARHSSIMICEGRYVRPNYKLDTLEDWVAQPPAYELHKFTDQDSSITGPTPAPNVSLSTASTMISSTTSDDTEEEETGERSSRSSSALEEQITQTTTAGPSPPTSALPSIEPRTDSITVPIPSAEPNTAHPTTISPLKDVSLPLRPHTNNKKQHATESKPVIVDTDVSARQPGVTSMFALRPAKSKSRFTLGGAAAGRNSEGERVVVKRSIFGL